MGLLRWVGPAGAGRAGCVGAVEMGPVVGACEELVAVLEEPGRVSDAHAFLALRPLWREGRLERPGGRSRQHILLAREMLRSAARGGLLSEEEARRALEVLRGG